MGVAAPLGQIAKTQGRYTVEEGGADAKALVAGYRTDYQQFESGINNQTRNANEHKAGITWNTQHAGSEPTATRSVSIARASCGLVRKGIPAGTPVRRRRATWPVPEPQAWDRYSRRSTRAADPRPR